MVDSCETNHELIEQFPLPHAIPQCSAAFDGETIVLSPPAGRTLLPAALNQSLFLKLMKDRVNRTFLPGESALGLLIDLPNDIVAIAGALFKDAQHEHRGGGADQFFTCPVHVRSSRQYNIRRLKRPVPVQFPQLLELDALSMSIHERDVDRMKMAIDAEVGHLPLGAARLWTGSRIVRQRMDQVIGRSIVRIG